MKGEYTAGLKFIYVYSSSIAKVSNSIYDKCRNMLDFITSQIPESKGDDDLFNRIVDWQALEQTKLEPQVQQLIQAIQADITTLKKMKTLEAEQREQLSRLEGSLLYLQKILEQLSAYETTRMNTLEQFIDINYHDERFSEVLCDLLITQFREQRKIILSLTNEHLWSYPLNRLQQNLEKDQIFSLENAKNWLREVTHIYEDFAIAGSEQYIKWFGDEDFDSIRIAE